MILPFIAEGARVLDIGSADGALLAIAPRLADYVGIDPTLERSTKISRGMLIKGSFPDDLPSKSTYDAITVLAVLEHIPTNQQRAFATSCAQRLNPGGHLLITVPSPRVDTILAMLKMMRLVDGMSLEEHYGFDVRGVPSIFAELGLRLLHHRKFQLGLNNLFVFRKSTAATNEVEFGR